MDVQLRRMNDCPEMEAILVDGLFSFSASEMNAVWCFYSFVSITTNPKNLSLRWWGICGSTIVSF